MSNWFFKFYFAWFLLLVPALIVMFMLGEAIRRKKLLTFANTTKILIERFSIKKRLIKQSLAVIALLFLVISLMGPQGGYELTRHGKRGIDIVFALDVSLSMLTSDVYPSRLENALIQMNNFIDKTAAEQRIALVLFAGSAFIFCPLTSDYEAIKSYLDVISPDLIQNQGTMLDNALSIAKSAFSAEDTSKKAIILLTDGEDHGQNINMKTLIQNFKEENISVFTIGIGKAEGKPIPLVDDAGEITNYLKDRSGKIVLSQLNDKVLKQIAAATGGAYYHAPHNYLSLQLAYDKIKSIKQQQLHAKTLNKARHYYQYALLLFIISAIFSYALSEKSNKN